MPSASSTLPDLSAALEKKFPALAATKKEFRGEVTYTVAEKAEIKGVLAFAKAELGFDFLTDVSSVDNFGEEPRFEVVYEISSLSHHQHLRLKTTVSEDDLAIPTICDLWRTADWHEREIYDMMGITFDGHPDLRRILMWDGYPYYPLRKDFPLEGKPSEVPEVAFTGIAPLAGGPFVSPDGGQLRSKSEPRARRGMWEENKEDLGSTGGMALPEK
jgi:NADH-quinone oxidoreductase subunit C